MRNPERKRSGWLVRGASVIALTLAVAAVLSGLLWHLRIALATRWARQALDREGLADARFQLAFLSPWRMVLEDIRLGTPEPVLSVDWMEIRFSYPDVIRGRLDRVRIRGIRTQIDVDAGQASSPLVTRIDALIAEREAASSRNRVVRRDDPSDTFGVGELSVYGMQVPVVGADGGTVLTVAGDFGLVAEPGGAPEGDRGPDRYRLWARVGDGAGLRVALTGSGVPANGQVALASEVELLDAAAWVQRMRRVWPDLPDAPRFVSAGRDLTLEGSLACDGWTNLTRRQDGKWQGPIGFQVAVLRPSVPLETGHAGAGVLRLEGTVSVVDGQADEVRAKIRIADAYFARRDFSLRGHVDSSWVTQRPFAGARGVFSGALSESVLLPQHQLMIREENVAFEGDAVVMANPSNTTWHVGLRVPEFGMVLTQEHIRAQAVAGLLIDARYETERLALNGDAWVRDAETTFGQADGISGEAGLGRIALRVDWPGCDAPSATEGAATASVAISNGWIRAGAAGSTGTLEGVQGEIPLTWTSQDGLIFPPGEGFTWQRLQAQGLAFTNEGLTVASDDQALVVRMAAGITDSRLKSVLIARMPFADPRQTVVEMAIPEASLDVGDAVTALLLKQKPDITFTGSVSAGARLSLPGNQPRVEGWGRMSDGTIRGRTFEIRGVSADVPFEHGVVFRTIKRPWVSCVSAQAGKVRLDAGRVYFQLAPEALFIDRMEVGWCKGSLNAYSVHLNLNAPRDDFVIYADRIDMGEALMTAFPFKGVIEGVLYGRIPVGFDGRRIKVYPGFLYSLPGQGGKIVLEDSRQILGVLAKAGIQGDVQGPLSKALADMALSTFRMDIEPREVGDGTLRIRLTGKSNFKEWPAPVDLNLNLHGSLEQLLNIGLDMSRK